MSGVLADRLATLPECLWAMRVAVPGGALSELAGVGDLAALDRSLPRGERLEAADPARGTRRIAILEGRRLAAALFVARERAALPSRDWLVGQLAMPAGPSVLADPAPGRQVDRGPNDAQRRWPSGRCSPAERLPQRPNCIL